jgi:hypothetical protein
MPQQGECICVTQSCDVSSDTSGDASIDTSNDTSFDMTLDGSRPFPRVVAEGRRGGRRSTADVRVASSFPLFRSPSAFLLPRKLGLYIYLMKLKKKESATSSHEGPRSVGTADDVLQTHVTALSERASRKGRVETAFDRAIARSFATVFDESTAAAFAFLRRSFVQNHVYCCRFGVGREDCSGW